MNAVPAIAGIELAKVRDIVCIALGPAFPGEHNKGKGLAIAGTGHAALPARQLAYLLHGADGTVRSSPERPILREMAPAKGLSRSF